MSKKFRLDNITIDGYYFLEHEGLFWHSDNFWYNELQLKKVANNGSLAVDLQGKKLGIKKLRKQARKCKITIEKYKMPF